MIKLISHLVFLALVQDFKANIVWLLRMGLYSQAITSRNQKDGKKFQLEEGQLFLFIGACNESLNIKDFVCILLMTISRVSTIIAIIASFLQNLKTLCKDYSRILNSRDHMKKSFDVFFFWLEEVHIYYEDVVWQGMHLNTLNSFFIDYPFLHPVNSYMRLQRYIFCFIRNSYFMC